MGAGVESVGSSVAPAVGSSVGSSVAPAVGSLVGSLVGCFVGSFVGSSVISIGALVGSFVGSFVGSSTGALVGSLVGFLVGSFVGLFVGSRVGLLVGLRVGFLVGVWVTSTASQGGTTPPTPYDQDVEVALLQSRAHSCWLATAYLRVVRAGAAASAVEGHLVFTAFAISTLKAVSTAARVGRGHEQSSGPSDSCSLRASGVCVATGVESYSSIPHVSLSGVGTPKYFHALQKDAKRIKKWL